MPIPSSLPPPGAPAAPGTLSSPLESRVGPWPAVLFLASLLAVVYLVRVGVIPAWSLAGLALWVAPSALFQGAAGRSELAAVSQLLAAHHQALSFLVSRLAESVPPPTIPAEPSSAVGTSPIPTVAAPPVLPAQAPRSP